MKEQSIAHGKTIIVAVACAFVFSEVASALLRIGFGAPGWGGNDLIRDVLTLILVYFLYQGYEWARLLTILLSLLAVLAGLYAAYLGFNASDLLIIYYGLMGAIINGACAAALIFSSGVAEFMQAQRNKRRHH